MAGARVLAADPGDAIARDVSAYLELTGAAAEDAGGKLDALRHAHPQPALLNRLYGLSLPKQGDNKADTGGARPAHSAARGVRRSSSRCWNPRRCSTGTTSASASRSVTPTRPTGAMPAAERALLPEHADARYRLALALHGLSDDAAASGS